jgi:hypothetical protein
MLPHRDAGTPLATEEFAEPYWQLHRQPPSTWTCAPPPRSSDPTVRLPSHLLRRTLWLLVLWSLGLALSACALPAPTAGTLGRLKGGRSGVSPCRTYVACACGMAWNGAGQEGTRRDDDSQAFRAVTK